MWTCVDVTSCDLLVNGLQPTTPRVNPAVSKAVFIADVIFETALFSCDNAELSGLSLFRRLASLSRSSAAAARLILKCHILF